MKVLMFALVTAIVAVNVYVIYKRYENQEKLIKGAIFIPIFVFFAVIFSVQYKKYDNYQNKEFVLNSDKKYIIHRESITRNGEELFYEVDLENEEITFRQFLETRKYKGTVSENVIDDVALIIKLTISDEDNLEGISDAEWHEFLQANAYDKYKIETYDGKEYYVRGAERVKNLTEMLEDYKNETVLD